MNRLLASLCLGLSIIGSGCARNKMSDRDLKRQQEKSAHDVKTNELTTVAGAYTGRMKSEAGLNQLVHLVISVKDIPEPVEGRPDPILVPKLSGFLRFQYGDENSYEYVDAPITKAELASDQKSLSVVVTQEQFKDLNVELTREESKLSGKWMAPALGASGTIELTRKGDSL